jgi:hypothetical protein
MATFSTPSSHFGLGAALGVTGALGLGPLIQLAVPTYGPGTAPIFYCVVATLASICQRFVDEDYQFIFRGIAAGFALSAFALTANDKDFRLASAEAQQHRVVLQEQPLDPAIRTAVHPRAAKRLHA